MVLKWKYTGETTITKNILLWEGVLVLKCKYREEVTITKNISLGGGVLVLKCKYTEATIKKNFTLGGSHGVPHKSHEKNTRSVILLVKQRHRASLLGQGTNQVLFRVFLKERNWHKREFYKEATLTKNISLWEGVLVLKCQIYSTSYNKKYFTLGGCTGLKMPNIQNKLQEQLLKKYFTLGGSAGLERPIYRRSYNIKKYFTLGGCIGLEMEIYRRNYNNEKYFTLGGCAGLERPIYRTSYNNKNYIHKKRYIY